MRIVIGIEYRGSDFFGWQKQKEARTVQGELESALSAVANSKVSTVCAGRTDTGVHALKQVVHFETQARRSANSWMRGSNSNLPDDVSVNWCLETTDSFHARYSALSRTYNYLILNRQSRSGVMYGRATWVPQKLDEMKMAEAAQSLLGEHDFSSFRARGCQAKSPIREVKQISVFRIDEYVIISVRANAFLQRMVRNFAGLLIEIGLARRTPTWARDVLLSKDREKAGVTAPPFGLYLVNVSYPKEYGIPEKAAILAAILKIHS